MFRKILFAITILLIVTSMTIRASGVFESIQVYRGDIKIAINNQWVELEEQPFIYKDRVYVPLRFISNSMGKEVEWVPEYRAVVIRDPDFNIPLEDCRPDKGEIFVYGKILKIDFDNYTIEIEQHFDDNSVQVDQPLFVRRDVVVVLQEKDQRNIHFCQLRAGDVGGFILDSNKKVRGIIVSRSHPRL